MILLCDVNSAFWCKRMARNIERVNPPLTNLCLTKNKFVVQSKSLRVNNIFCLYFISLLLFDKAIFLERIKTIIQFIFDKTKLPMVNRIFCFYLREYLLLLIPLNVTNFWIYQLGVSSVSSLNRGFILNLYGQLVLHWNHRLA